ncbi:MAG: 4-hydroxybenzoate octaprenyltransferase [Burkholderiaceae bacterium]
MRKISLYARLIRFDKPVGTLLLLWPTLGALWIAAAGRPSLALILIFFAGTFLMRSAGCAVNDAADADFDVHVERTRERVVATGELARSEAIVVAGLMAAAAALLLILLNAPTLRLALVALALAVTYPLFKRFFPIPQLYLGMAFSFGIPMAFAAVQGSVPPLGWLMFVANLFWVVAYDTEYAMVDRDDDLRLGVRSSAVFFGRADVAAIMVCYVAYLAAMAVIGVSLTVGWPYWLGLGAATLCALIHYRWIRDRTRAGCFRAFLHNNWFGLAVFGGIVADYALT